MLSELFIQNFAIIDELRLRFVDGFNVMTGETGAGKSIILDAMSLILGSRADTTMIRAGAEQAYIEATFELSPTVQAAVKPILEEAGLADEEEDVLVIARELREEGRNVVRVNSRTARMSTLREIGDFLIDIHGQGDHLSLLRPKSHLPLLDAFGGLGSQRRALAAEVKSLRGLEKELTGLRQDERDRVQRIEFLQYRVDEINAANLKPEEEEELLAERLRLGNAEQLTQGATEAIAYLIGADEDSPAALDAMGQAERSLQTLARIDETQAPLLARLQGLASELNEVAADVQAYLDDLEFNPKRLDFLEERIELINSLKRKYGGDIPAILNVRDVALAELDAISGRAERINELENLSRRQKQRLSRLAAALSDKRQAAAKQLAAAVVTELAELRMDGARFAVDFQREPAENGLPMGDEVVAFDGSGVDKVEFLISTNPGEPLKPMAKVASGGETARLMLALKSALAQVDETPTLIFDEIDQGIGGRIGAIVGDKLWRLTVGGGHQVIVVTHLPQLAGFGDRHFHVSKRVVGERTITAVADLEGDGRVQELAAMLGTGDAHARDGAASILSQAQTSKQAVRASEGG